MHVVFSSKDACQTTSVIIFGGQAQAEGKEDFISFVLFLLCVANILIFWLSAHKIYPSNHVKCTSPGTQHTGCAVWYILLLKKIQMKY